MTQTSSTRVLLTASVGSRSDWLHLTLHSRSFAKSSRADCRDCGANSTRRDGRVVDGGGLENHCTGNRAGGSNPSPSATFREKALSEVEGSERSESKDKPISKVVPHSPPIC